MAKVLTKQEELDRIFRKMQADYGAFNRKQRAYAIREIGRVRGEVADLLADFSNSDGVIKRNRTRRLLREMDKIEESMRKTGTDAFEKVVEDTSEWTGNKVGVKAGLALNSTQFDRVNEHVYKYVVKRFGSDGLVLSDRVWGLSGEIRDEMASAIRSGIIKGDGINSIVPEIRKVYENETWKIDRVARTESLTAHRAAISYSADESNVVEWVQFHAGDDRSDACVELANEDRHGAGKGVFRPNDTDIYSPHPNCTSYMTYILNERWL